MGNRRISQEGDFGLMFKKTGYIVREENGYSPIGYHHSYPQIYDIYGGAVRAVGKGNEHKIFLVELVEFSDDKEWRFLDRDTKKVSAESFGSRIEAEKARRKRESIPWNRYEIVFEE